jgi:hypothetical protein
MALPMDGSAIQLSVPQTLSPTVSQAKGKVTHLNHFVVKALSRVLRVQRFNPVPQSLSAFY